MSHDYIDQVLGPDPFGEGPLPEYMAKYIEENRERIEAQIEEEARIEKEKSEEARKIRLVQEYFNRVIDPECPLSPPPTWKTHDDLPELKVGDSLFYDADEDEWVLVEEKYYNAAFE